MRKPLRYAGFAALALALPLAAQSKDKKDAAKDLGITRQQADDILSELRQIRQLLESQQTARAGAQAQPQQQQQRPTRASVTARS